MTDSPQTPDRDDDEATEPFDPATFEPGSVAEEEEALAAAVQEFWEVARTRAGLGKVSVVTGVFASETLSPPVWAFGDSPELADELIGAVLRGEKTATSTALWDFQDGGEDVPKPGDLSIVLDGDGRPRALVRTTTVDVVPFGDVTEDFAVAEGDGTLEAWREGHEAFFRRNLADGREFSDELPVVCEHFEVLYPKL